MHSRTPTTIRTQQSKNTVGVRKRQSLVWPANICKRKGFFRIRVFLGAMFLVLT